MNVQQSENEKPVNAAEASTPAIEKKALKKSSRNRETGGSPGHQPNIGDEPSKEIVTIPTITGSPSDDAYRVENTPAPNITVMTNARGIGDNSGHVDAIIEGETTSAAEREAVLAIATFNSAMVSAAISMRPITREALAKLFAVIWPILAEGQYEAFCETHHIYEHGNTGNKCQPLVGYYFQSYHQPHVRQVVSRWGMIFAGAIHEGIEPAKFPAWLEGSGLEKVVARYKKLKNPGRAKAKTPDYEALARLALADPSTAPWVKGSPVTAGHAGDRIAYVRLHHSGSGDYQTLAILPHETDEVIRIAGEVVLKKQKAAK